MATATNTTTGTEEEPTGLDSLAELPGFQPVRPPMPGPYNPDPAPAAPPAGQDGEPAAAGSGGQPGRSTRVFTRARGKTFAAIADGLLTAAGGWLNAVSQKTTGDEFSTAFAPDDDDRELIPPPLGRLAARRIKLGEDTNLSDVEDVGMLIVGTVAWLAKGLTAHVEARRERRRLEAGKAVHQGDADEARQ